MTWALSAFIATSCVSGTAALRPTALPASAKVAPSITMCVAWRARGSEMLFRVSGGYIRLHSGLTCRVSPPCILAFGKILDRRFLIMDLVPPLHLIGHLRIHLGNCDGHA